MKYKPLRRYCKDCPRKFVPKGVYQIKCDKCLEKAKQRIIKSRAFTIRMEGYRKHFEIRDLIIKHGAKLMKTKWLSTEKNNG